MQLPNLSTVNHYHEYVRELDKLSAEDRHEIARYLCRRDLYFLLWWGCGLSYFEDQWLLDRCKEVQASPNGHLDLWARGHCKSTIITFGKTIQDILASHGDDPLPEWNGREVTIAIFSHTRPIANKFVNQIKTELETNKVLKQLFPDILWNNPAKEALKWSEQVGISVRRKSNPKEQTVEGWGVVEGQPIGIHPLGMVFDDLVTKSSVNTPEMIHKTMEHYQISLNLAMEDTFIRIIGTFYDFNDPYKQMIKNESVNPRIYPATHDGTMTGNPVFFKQETLDKKRREQGPYVYSCQMLLNPVADHSQGFRKDWLRHYDYHTAEGMNVYIFVDPANEKKRSSDYSVFLVMGLGPDENYYVLDMVRDRINLTQRAETLFRLHKKWRPIKVGYEKYGKDADISHIEEKMNRENYRFDIKELGGNVKKDDRIRALIPPFEQGRLFLPNSCFKTDYEGKTRDLVDVFIHEEYLTFNKGSHDDMLDAMARVLDPEFGAYFPIIYEESPPDRYSQNNKSKGSSWAA